MKPHPTEKVRIRAHTTTEYVVSACSSRPGSRMYREMKRFDTLEAAVDYADKRFGPLAPWIGYGPSVVAYTQEYLEVIR